MKQWVTTRILQFFQLLPIKQNKIFFMSYYGAQFSCNPKYITTYIVNEYEEGIFDLVWALNDPAKVEHNGSFRVVKTMSLRYFYELATAKVIITNYRMTADFTKRTEQYYVQTWHSSLRLKQIERDATDTLPASYIDMAKKDSAKCNLLLSGCTFSTNIFRRAFWYDGEILEHGTPRNDFLLEQNDVKKVSIYEKLNIDPNERIVLYAPTFRKNVPQPVNELDFRKIKRALETTFSGSWTVLIKLHPHLMHQRKEIVKDTDVIDVTIYDDIQELLYVADVVISDYSSLIFDFLLTERPCFLFVPDWKTYRENERNLYFELEELPFLHAKTNEDLLSHITSFNETIYKQRVKLFLTKVGSFERKEAAKKLLERLEAVCFERGKGEKDEAV